MSEAQALKIAIVGAGPAGLILARLLSHSPSSKSFNITIFESDASPSSRRANGGTLDLHPTTGLLALKNAGLYDQFLQKARYDGSSLLLCDKAGKGWFKILPRKEGEAGIGNPEIDRVELRAMLLASLMEGEESGKVDILWGMKASRLVQSNGAHELHFANGETRSGFDLVVGADGAWSKVRSTYLDTVTKPEYSKVMGFDFSVPDAKVKAEKEWAFVNKGSVFAFGDGKSLMGQQLGDGSLYVHAWHATEQGKADEGVFTKTGDEVLEDFVDWNELLRNFVAKAENESAESRFLYALPEDYQWEHKPSVTLLGDAAHLMLPFAGEGVNLAFEDAINLSEAILKGVAGGNLDKEITKFEGDMFARAKRAQKMTRGKTKAMLFTEGAPKSSIESWLLSSIEYKLPAVAKWGYPAVVAGVYGYYFIAKRMS